VRIASTLTLTLLLALTACHHAPNQDAVRQGVLDYLAGKKNLSMGGMNVDVANVTFNGDKAEASVNFTPKNGPAGSNMTMRYTLEQKDGKWVVTGKADSGSNPHGGSGAVPPGMTNPHEGGAMPGGMGGATPGAAPAIDPEKPGGGTGASTGTEKK
jgi:hypothetical protein